MFRRKNSDLGACREFSVPIPPPPKRLANINAYMVQYNGEAGVDLAVKILLDEFKRTMMLTGYVDAAFKAMYVLIRIVI